jgi:putative FmdB family regulatory protein
MPTYDYACSACGHRFEVIHGVHGHGPETCPNCGGGPLRKAVVAPTFVFKGSGWAKVDRRPSQTATKPAKDATDSKDAKDSGGDAAKPAADGGGGSDTATTTVKTDTGSASKPTSPD